MSETKYWDQRNHRIYSKVGHWQGGVDVNIHHYSLMNNLMKNASYMQVHILNATGKYVEQNVANWIEINFMGLSYPDSRIWCNQISAYASDTNATGVAAVSAAILSTDSRAYGGSQTTFSCMKFLVSSYNRYKNGETFSSIIQNERTKNGKPIIVGFARPIDKDDERLSPYELMQEKLGIEVGDYLMFAKELSEYLDEHYSLTINSGGYASAFLLDQAFTPTDGYNIKAYAVASGAIACHRNLASSPPNSFLPLKCLDVEYTGKAIRRI